MVRGADVLTEAGIPTPVATLGGGWTVFAVSLAPGGGETGEAMAGINEEAIAPVLDDLAERLADADPARVKDFLPEIIERVALDPATLECRIHYRIAVQSRHKLASPRGFEPLLPP